MCGRCENYVPISASGTCKVLLLQKCFGVIGWVTTKHGLRTGLDYGLDSIMDSQGRC